MRKVLVLVDWVVGSHGKPGWPSGVEFTNHFIYSFVKFLSHQWRVSSGVLRALLSFLFTSVYPWICLYSPFIVFYIYVRFREQKILCCQSHLQQWAVYTYMCWLMDWSIHSFIQSVSQQICFEHVLPTWHFSGSWVPRLRPVPTIYMACWRAPVGVPSQVTPHPSLWKPCGQSSLYVSTPSTPPQTAASGVPCPPTAVPSSTIHQQQGTPLGGQTYGEGLHKLWEWTQGFWVGHSGILLSHQGKV